MLSGTDRRTLSDVLAHEILLYAGKNTPVVFHEGVSFAYVQYSNLYLLTVSRTNINAAAFLGFLHKLREVFVHYFNELEEESLRDNFVIAYELLDEVFPKIRALPANF